MTRAQPVTLIGHVGRDPYARTLPGREQLIARVYDEIVDETLERTFDVPPREVTTFSLAVHSTRTEDHSVTTRWYSCTDFDGIHCRMVRKGCRVRVRGLLTVRHTEGDGGAKTYHNVRVQEVRILSRPKPRVYP